MFLFVQGGRTTSNVGTCQLTDSFDDKFVFGERMSKTNLRVYCDILFVWNFVLNTQLNAAEWMI